MKILNPLLILIVFTVSSASSMKACQVPVFKYALDYWAPENYPLTVYHQGALTAPQQSFVNSLTPSTEKATPNLQVTLRDLSNPANSIDDGTNPTQAAKNLPWLVLRHPSTFTLKIGSQAVAPVWAGTPEEVFSQNVFNSPARREIVKRLQSGDSIIWLLLEGENAEENTNASKLLQTEIKKLEKTARPPQDLTAPPPVPNPEDAPDEIAEPVNIVFTMMRLARTDASETQFIAQLLSLNPELHDTKGPIVFPIFGRARTLDGIAGTALNAETLERRAIYLCGDCSCTIKAQNPGADLLVTALWPPVKKKKNDIVREAQGLSSGLPSVSKLITPIPAYLRPKVAETKAPSEIKTETSSIQSQGKNATTASETPPAGNSLLRNIGIAFITLLVLVGGVSFAILRKPSGRNNR